MEPHCLSLCHWGLDWSSHSRYINHITASSSGTLTPMHKGRLIPPLGLKKSFLCNNIILIAGALTLSLSNSVAALIAGRIIIGVGSGITTVLTSVYLNDIAPDCEPHMHGAEDLSIYHLCLYPSFSFCLHLLSLPSCFHLLFAISQHAHSIPSPSIFPFCLYIPLTVLLQPCVAPLGP